MVNFKQPPPTKKTKIQPQKPVNDHKQNKKNTTTGFNKILLLAIVLISTSIAFSPTLNNHFIETWDDGVYVTDNPVITSFSRDHLQTMFTTSVNGTYVPLPLLTLATEYHFFKLDPKPYHIHNLILHLICVTLVFFILTLFGLKPVYAFFGSLMFGIHPMRTESVAWITERKDLLFSVFYLSALICWIHFIKLPEKKKRFYWLTLVFFILSLFSKIQAVTLPLSLLLIDYLLKRPLNFKLLTEKIPHGALSLGFGIAGILFLEKTGSLAINMTYSLVERTFLGLHSLLIYLGKFLYPHPLSIFYPYPFSPGNAMPFLYYIAPVILLAVAVAVFFTRKNNRVIIFGSLFFLFNIMFLLQILGAGTAFQADRFTYIPYLGLFFIAAWAAQTFADKNNLIKTMIFPVLIIVSTVWGVMTYQRNKEWKNSETIWTAVIDDFPGVVATAYGNRASYYRNNNQYEKALNDYNLAILKEPANAMFRMNRGNLYYDLGDLDSAYKDYQFTLRHLTQEIEQFRLYANLSAVYAKRKQSDSAMYYLNRSIKINPSYAIAYLNRALVYEQYQQWDEAITDYKKYLEFKPEDDRVYSSVGVAFQHKRMYPESILWFEKGMKWNPNSGLHYNNRSYSFNAMGERDKAKTDIIKARELGFAINPNYLLSLGIQ